jgi:hypothetical protein
MHELESAAAPITIKQEEFVQITGTRALVTFRLGANPMNANLEVGADCMRGETIKIKFDMNRAMLIDPLSGIAIYPPS